MAVLASRDKKNAALHERRNNLAGYLFISPMLLVFCVFLAFSILFLIHNSFTSVTISFLNQRFVGLHNYSVVLSDKKFWKALLDTFLLSGMDIFAGLTLGFLISVFLSFHFRGRKFFHTLFFIPSMLPLAFIAAVFSSMLEYREGTLNELLRFLNLNFLAQRWLSDPKLAMMSVMSVSIYLIGIPIMYYTADLTTINVSIFEAAIIDGANLPHMLSSILYPLLKNSHKTIALSLLLGGFRHMERVYLMTDGGPGGSTEIVGTYIYRLVRSPSADYGIVSAAAILVLVLAFVISFVQLKLFTAKTK